MGPMPKKESFGGHEILALSRWFFGRFRNVSYFCFVERGGTRIAPAKAPNDIRLDLTIGGDFG